ncbi:hypothetical protein OROMI_015855 [Orobanche minor]
MATLVQHQHINFGSAPISSPPYRQKQPQITTLLKTSQKPTKLQGSLVSLTNKLVLKTPNTFLDDAYASVLDQCASENSLLHGKQIHTHIQKRNNACDLVFLCTKLVYMYGKGGSLSEAEHLFDEMPDRNIFTYNAILGAYVSNGEHRKAVELYADMRFLDIPVDAHTCSCVLKGCSEVKDLYCGKELHGYAVKFGFLRSDIVVNSLMSVYAQCNDMDAMELLYYKSTRGDVVSWNLMISAYAANGMSKEAWTVFVKMQQDGGVTPSTYTYVAALQACDELLSGMQIHALALKSSLHFDRYVGNALLVMYSKFSRIEEAARVFVYIDDRDNVSWNSMLDTFVENGMYYESLDFFRESTKSGWQPDQVSVISILSACGRSGNLLNGMEVHAFALKMGMELDLQVGNTITDMYAKCSKTSYMDSAFRRNTQKDYISWTTVISGYVQNHHYTKALQLLREVLVEKIEIDKLMVESVLLACRGLKCTSIVKEIHGYILRNELSDIVMQNTFVDVYGQCGEVDYSRNIFKLIEFKNVISWTSMIACYVQNGLANDALELSLQMAKSGVELDPVALLSVISAAANLSSLRKGKEIHGFLVRKYMHLWESIPSSLVDMYASCGAVDNSYKVFDCVEDKGLVLWTSMINAYGKHGQGMTAIELFKRMEAENIRPDHIAFLALLYACSHSSLVNEGKLYFNSMKSRYDLEPWPEHYACLVDLIGRANCLEEAFELVNSMRMGPTAAVWCALLGACINYSNMEIGEIAAKRLLEFEPENPGNYVLLSNLYALGERWEDVEKVRVMMKAMGLKKDPGCSWIEINNKVHTFITRDRSHPMSDEIYGKLNETIEKLKREGGYKAETSYVLHNVEEEEKVKLLYGHSERLALAYGLLSTGQGMAIRVTKNLRVCGDCHAFTKLVSKVFKRDIVVRDSSRFHHFRDGVCSCEDFW